ncbi:MAG: hypothetical protein ACLTF6_16695 [Clostridium sp.]
MSPTYGCIVYQEQVMQIVRDLGGYTMGRSDLVRRAMSKKKTVGDGKRARRILFTEIRRRAYRAASPMESRSRSDCRYMPK